MTGLETATWLDQVVPKARELGVATLEVVATGGTVRLTLGPAPVRPEARRPLTDEEAEEQAAAEEEERVGYAELAYAATRAAR